MKLSRFLSILAVGVVLVGCADPGRGWMGSPLKDTSWQLVTVESRAKDGGRQYVASQVDIEMTLRASGDAAFTLGCEQGTTDWRATPDRVDTQGEIRFYAIEVAASSCEPDLIVSQFLDDVTFLKGYVLIQNHLYLDTEANEKTYGWRKLSSQ